MYNNIIIIPYRNRKKHLDYYIKNTIPLIRKHLKNTKVIVVEQEKGKLFNRGMMLNIGFHEYQSKYFITQDVDINPTEKCIIYYYNKEVNDNNVLGIYTSHCNTLGGIIKIKKKDLYKINGFPNDIWGWGSEDKALQNRSEYYGLKKITNLLNNKKHPDLILRFNDVNDRIKKNTSKNTNIHYNLFKKLNKEEKEKMILSSGLNNLKYKIIEKTYINDIVEKIKVSV
jgi:hypothetical protein